MPGHSPDIGEIARSICSDAEARYELSHGTSDAERVLSDGSEADKSVQEAERAVTTDDPGYALA